MSLEDVSLVDLTIWSNDPEEPDDPFVAEVRAEIARRGGPAEPAAVRAKLQARAADRAEGARQRPQRGPHAVWSRTTPCGCGATTEQLLHGYTRDGLLWKGHVCMCNGWECADCGRILDRSDDCCR